MCLPLHTFRDELEKIAAAGSPLFSSKRMREFAARLKGRHRQTIRPRKATTVLQQNTVRYKLGEYNPTMGNASAPQTWMLTETSPRNPNRKKGDVPSRDEMDTNPRRIDGRDGAATIYAPGAQLNSIGSNAFSIERT